MALKFASVVAVANAGSVHLDWDDCGDADTHTVIIDISPVELALPGSTTITGSGLVDQDVNAGQFKFDAKLEGVSVLKDGGSLCENKHIVFPLNAGNIDFHGINCPVAAGEISVTLDINLADSKAITNDLLTIDLSALSDTGDKLLCASLSVVEPSLKSSDRPDCSGAACEANCECSYVKCSDQVDACLAVDACAASQDCAFACACGDGKCLLACAAKSPSLKALTLAKCITSNCDAASARPHPTPTPFPSPFFPTPDPSPSPTPSPSPFPSRRRHAPGPSPPQPSLTGNMVYHLFERKYTGLANKDGGDFKGDAGFIFGTFNRFESTNPEASMESNILEMSEVNVTEWGRYEECNAPGCTGSFTCPANQTVYCCTHGRTPVTHTNTSLPGLEANKMSLGRQFGDAGWWFSFPMESENVTWTQRLVRRIEGKCLGDAWRKDAGGCDSCGDELDQCVGNCVKAALCPDGNTSLLQATWDRVWSDPTECEEVALPEEMVVV